ncbi:hypothetical protein BH10PSE11_BH10PSE11_27940 [soil metagenome]
MSNRTAVVAFAVITGCISIFSITSLSGSAANAADECLSAPKATTPAGAHWYYRIEKGTKRKCWYLADEGAKTNKAAAAAPAPTSSDTAEQDAPPPTKITPSAKLEATKKSIQKSVANARAELTTGTDDDPSLAESTWPPMPGPSADAATRSDNQAAAIQPAPGAANRQGWNVATRWPEPTAVVSASDQSAAAPQQSAQSAPALTAERLATAAATPSAAPQAAVTTGTAAAQSPQQSTPSDDSEGMSLRVMLSVLVCLLALIAILGPMLFKYLRPKPRQDERIDGQRRSIWDSVENDETTIIWQDNPPPISARRPARVLDEPRMMDEPRVLNEAADEIE